jgi:hypothetical protein
MIPHRGGWPTQHAEVEERIGYHPLVCRWGWVPLLCVTAKMAKSAGSQADPTSGQADAKAALARSL